MNQLEIQEKLRTRIAACVRHLIAHDAYVSDMEIRLIKKYYLQLSRLK